MVNFEAEDKFVAKAAKTKAEAEPLIEAGCQYVVTTPDGYMLFRKRK
jgi:hypothetical protein